MIAGIVILFVAIFIHELGHWIAARLFGFRAPTFSIGFGPAIGRFSFGGTQWQLAWIPLGGYVELPQMSRQVVLSSNPSEPLASYAAAVIDEGQTLEPASGFPRAVVALAGPMMNFVVALGALLVMLFVAGDRPSTTQKALETNEVGYVFDDAFHYISEEQLEQGDRIVRIDESPVASIRDISYKVRFGATNWTLGANRGGREFTVVIARRSGAKRLRFPVLPKEPVIVESATQQPGSLALAADLQPGDTIEKIDGIPIGCPVHLAAELAMRGGTTAQFAIRRGANMRENPWLIPQGMRTAITNLGIHCRTEEISAAPLVFRTVGRMMDALEKDLRPANAISAVGPVGVVAFVEEESRGKGWIKLLELFAVLNLSLGIINLLPVPPADGGRLVGGLIEFAIRRPVPAMLKHLSDFFAIGFGLGLLGLILFSDLGFLARKGLEQLVPPPAEAISEDRAALTRAADRVKNLRWADAELRADSPGDSSPAKASLRKPQSFQ